MFPFYIYQKRERRFDIVEYARHLCGFCSKDTCVEWIKKVLAKVWLKLLFHLEKCFGMAIQSYFVL